MGHGGDLGGRGAAGPASQILYESCPAPHGTEAIPWLTGAVRLGCTCAAGAVSTYARQDPTGGGPPYRVLRGETHSSMVYLGEAAASARSTRLDKGCLGAHARCRGGRARLR